MSAEKNLYQCSFRIHDSHFILDLDKPLSCFWSDVVLCFTPQSEKLAGLMAGLEFSGRNVGGLEGLKGKSKFLMRTTASEEDLSVIFQHQLREMQVRKVAFTDPNPLPQHFIAICTQLALDFLANSPYSTVVFSTVNKGLYEQVFNVMSAQGKVTFEEGNGVVDEGVLVRTAGQYLRCRCCGQLAYGAHITHCCHRLICSTCIPKTPTCCSRPITLTSAPCCRKLLSNTKLTCNCGLQLLYQDYDLHYKTCPSTETVCAICQGRFNTARYANHVVTTHGDEVLNAFATVMSPKDSMIHQQHYVYIAQEQQPLTWSCPHCTSYNSLDQVYCIRCSAPRS